MPKGGGLAIGKWLRDKSTAYALPSQADLPY